MICDGSHWVCRIARQCVEVGCGCEFRFVLLRSVRGRGLVQSHLQCLHLWGRWEAQNLLDSLDIILHERHATMWRCMYAFALSRCTKVQGFEVDNVYSSYEC